MANNKETLKLYAYMTGYAAAIIRGVLEEYLITEIVYTINE